MTLEVGYWNLRGLVGFIRLIDVYTQEGVKWVNYGIAERDQWLAEKSNNEHGLDFPNLPWMKDGDLKITQSLAILKYIARRHNLANDKDAALAATSDMVEQQTIDTRAAWGKFNYGGKTPDEEYKTETLLPQLKQWDAYLTGKEWLNGSSLSYLDFLFWEVLDHVSLVFPEAIKANQEVLAFYKRFANLPQILAYLESDKFQVSPISGPRAKYGGDDSLKRKEKLYL